MSNSEQQPNIESNLQTLENELVLTKQEITEFKKLSKEEREKQRDQIIIKLKELQIKLEQTIQEAIKTGDLAEAKKLKEGLEKEIQNLEEKIKIIEGPKIIAISSNETLRRSLERALSVIGSDKDLTIYHLDIGPEPEAGEKYRDRSLINKSIEELEKITETYKETAIFIVNNYNTKEELIALDPTGRFKDFFDKNPNITVVKSTSVIADIRKAIS